MDILPDLLRFLGRVLEVLPLDGNLTLCSGWLLDARLLGDGNLFRRNGWFQIWDLLRLCLTTSLDSAGISLFSFRSGGGFFVTLPPSQTCSCVNNILVESSTVHFIKLSEEIGPLAGDLFRMKIKSHSSPLYISYSANLDVGKTRHLHLPEDQ